MKPKTIIRRLIVEMIILFAAWGGIHMQFSPSERTALAVREAANKSQLDPICSIEVHSAMRFAGFMNSTMLVVLVAAWFLICSDMVTLWQSRRGNNR